MVTQSNYHRIHNWTFSWHGLGKALSATVLLLISATASAGTMTFDFSDGTNSGSVLLYTNDASPNVATSGTLIVTGGIDIGTYSLFMYLGGVVISSQSGLFFFDNLVSPFGDPVIKDAGGLLFTGTLSGNYIEINMWGNNPPGTPYSFWSETLGSYNIGSDSVTLSNVTFVPEPISMALFGIGLAGLGMGRRRAHQPA